MSEATKAKEMDMLNGRLGRQADSVCDSTGIQQYSSAVI